MSEIKTAEDFLKSKGVKDTLYDRRQGIEANQWIKGGLSNLLNEFASQFQSKEHGEELKRLLIKESVVQQYSTAEQAAFQMGGDFILSKKALSLSPSLDKEKEELKKEIERLRRIVQNFDELGNGDHKKIILESESNLSLYKSRENDLKECQKTIDLLMGSHNKLQSEVEELKKQYQNLFDSRNDIAETCTRHIENEMRLEERMKGAEKLIERSVEILKPLSPNHGWTTDIESLIMDCNSFKNSPNNN